MPGGWYWRATHPRKEVGSCGCTWQSEETKEGKTAQPLVGILTSRRQRIFHGGAKTSAPGSTRSHAISTWLYSTASARAISTFEVLWPIPSTNQALLPSYNRHFGLAI
jgi:hypothetical protein